jgi:hypothetical protein
MVLGMTLSRTLLAETDDLYVPDYKLNIYRALPTALRCMDVQVPRDDLLGEQTVRAHLTATDALKAERVIFCIVDSLGINNMQGTPIAKLFSDLRGVTLSSTFPTITSSAVTSIHLGVPPTTHGILGHQIYFREYGVLVDTLRMAGADVRARDAIPYAGIDVRVLRWANSIAEQLQEANSRVVYADCLPGHIAGTGIGHFFTLRSNMVPYTDYVDAFGALRRLLSRFSSQPLFVALYVANIDFLAHKYGPYTPEYKEGCDTFLRHLRSFAESLTAPVAKKTTIVITSDHGQHAIRDERRIIFTRDQLAEVKGTLRVPPGYSGRVMHFYCASPAKRQRLKRWLREQVGDRAVIMDIKELNSAGLLPVPATRAIVDRLGDLLLLCREGANPEIERRGSENQPLELLPPTPLLGSHGSTTADELYVPFLGFNAQALR